MVKIRVICNYAVLWAAKCIKVPNNIKWAIPDKHSLYRSLGLLTWAPENLTFVKTEFCPSIFVCFIGLCLLKICVKMQPKNVNSTC